jgi:hypothetical protein
MAAGEKYVQNEKSTCGSKPARPPVAGEPGEKEDADGGTKHRVRAMR